jgi:uncharacterized GH25 family protein
VFRVLVVAKGFEPAFFTDVDPRKGPLEAGLKPRAAPSMPPSQIISGRVLDPAKRPLANAVVSVESTTIGNTTYGRPPEGTDPLAVTDEKGEFEMRCPEKFDSMELRVEARGFARRGFPETRPGPRRQDLVVTAGAALTGRVLDGGRPARNITVGVASVDRSIGNFTGDFVTGTGEDGRFVLPNLPPHREYAVYGLMDSLKGIGALPTRIVRLGGDGSTNLLDDWKLTAGFRLEGQVRLADAKPIPAHTHLLLGREAAWDTTSIELPPDGRFQFANVPAESVSLGTRVSGYRFSARNASLDRLNPFHLLGRLESDKTNLVILLEPGNNLEPDYGADDAQPRDLPVCGIETKRAIPNAVLIGGHVLDAADGAPVPRFRVTPGLRQDPRSEWVQWQRGRAVEGTNGGFLLELSAKGGAIVFQVEAPGYLPALSEPLGHGESNCVVRLKKGTGPAGIVQLPDGTPLPNTEVTYVSGEDQTNMGEDGRVRALVKGVTQRTDSAGRFNFAPKLGQGELVVGCPGGFARLSLASSGGTNVIIVQPWAEVRGRLVKGGKPIPNEHVDLSFHSEWKPGRPHLGLHGTVTDEQGRFTIDHVPPGELQLTTRVAVEQPRGAWTEQRQRYFAVQPGEKADLGDVEKGGASLP